MKLYALIATLIATLSATSLADEFSQKPANLSDIFQLALVNDQEYQAALAQTRVQMSNKGVLSAGIKPQLTAFYTYKANSSDVVSGFPIGIDSDNNPNTPDEVQVLRNANQQDETSNNWGVTLSQTLFDARAFADAYQGKLEYANALLAVKQAEQDLVLRVSSQYFDTLRADNNLRVAQAQYESDEWLLKQTQGRYDVGSVAYTDVNQAKAALDLSRAQLLAAKLEVDNQRNALSIITAVKHNALAPVASYFKPALPMPNSNQEWQQRATENNLNVLIKANDMKVAKAAAKAAKASRLPTITAKLNYYDNSNDVSIPSIEEFNNSNVGNSVEISLNAPLYLGGSIGARSRQSQAFYQSALQQYHLSLRQSEQQALSAFNSLNVAVSLVEAQAQAVKSAQSAAESIEAGYSAGINTIIDLVSAKRSFYAAQKDFENSKFDYLQIYLSLEASVGQLTSEDINHLNQQLEF